MIKEIAFTVYTVKDIARARKFYEETLGLKLAMNFSDGWIEYDIAGATFAITNMFQTAGPAGSVAFEVDDLDAEVARLKSADVKFEGEGDIHESPVCRMALIHDPDENTICIHQRKS